MMLKSGIWLLTCFLLVFFAACSNAPATQPPLPTVADPTALPRATAIVPTLVPFTDEPSTQATEIPPATASTESVLPGDAVWVFIDTAIVAATRAGDTPNKPQIILGEDPVALNPFSIRVAPNGSRLFYVLSDDMGQSRYYTVDTVTGAQTLIHDAPNVHLVTPRFSPDGSQIAFARVDQSRDPVSWQLEIMGERPGDSRVLTQYVIQGPTDHLQPLAPMAWTPNGLFVEQLLWASDAPPHGIARLDPQDGSTEMLNDEDHLRAEISANGERAALLTGILPMGPDVEAMSTLTTLDLQTGETQPLFTDGKFWVSTMRWSPDASRLLYTKQANLAVPVTALVVNTPDGGSEQTLAIGENKVPAILHDAAWRDNDTVLLLVADTANQLHLYEANLDAFTPDALQEVAVFDGSKTPNVPPRILYVPE